MLFNILLALLGMSAFVRGRLVVLWCLSTRSRGKALSEIRLGIKTVVCCILSLAAGSFLFAVCWCVCDGLPEGRVLRAALQSSATELDFFCLQLFSMNIQHL